MFLKSKFLNKFKTCYLIIKRLKHPNIVELVDTFGDDHFVYLVMEL